MKIFVGGSLRDVQVDGTLCRQFVEKFAEKIFTASILYSQGVGALWIKPSLRQQPPGFIVMDKRKIFATE